MAVSIAAGFVLTYQGVATWDALPHLDRSRWLLQKYGLPMSRPVSELGPTLKWYGPLWMLILGVFSEVVLGFLRDPMWVQHALNFALYPLGLVAVYRLLAQAGVAPRNAEIVIDNPFDAASVQYLRLRQGLLSRIDGFGPYRLVHKATNPGAYVIAYNRLRTIDEAIEAARTGRGRIFWSTSMPPGDPACVITQSGTQAR